MGQAGFLQTLDARLFFLVNGWAGRVGWFDKLSASFTKLSPVIFLVILAVCFFLPSPRRAEMRRAVVLSGIAGVLAVALSFIIMIFVYRARPFVTLPPDQMLLLVDHAADSSFPSNHTIGSAALAAGMAASPSRSARWFTLLTAVFVALSRIIVGVHWPGDVIISALLGIGVAKLVLAAAPGADTAVDPFLGLLSRLKPGDDSAAVRPGSSTDPSDREAPSNPLQRRSLAGPGDPEHRSDQADPSRPGPAYTADTSVPRVYAEGEQRRHRRPIRIRRKRPGRR